MPYTEKPQIFISQVLEPGVQHQGISMAGFQWGPSPNPQEQTAFLPWPYMAEGREGVREHSGVSFWRALIPFLGAPSTWPEQRPHLLLPAKWALGFHIEILGGHRHPDQSSYLLQNFRNFRGSGVYLRVGGRVKGCARLCLGRQTFKQIDVLVPAKWIFCVITLGRIKRARSSWGLEQSRDRVVGRSWKERDWWVSIESWDWTPGSLYCCTEEFELCFLGRKFHPRFWPVEGKIRCGLREKPSILGCQTLATSASETISGF